MTVHWKIKFSNISVRNILLSENRDSFIIYATKIYKKISSLVTNKSCRSNSVPIKFLHLVQDRISQYLATICNFATICLCKNITHHFETTKVILIHKNNSKLEVSNHRPISVLSKIDKIFETLIRDRFNEVLKKNKQLYCKQFGFQINF